MRKCLRLSDKRLCYLNESDVILWSSIKSWRPVNGWVSRFLPLRTGAWGTQVVGFRSKGLFRKEYPVVAKGTRNDFGTVGLRKIHIGKVG